MTKKAQKKATKPTPVELQVDGVHADGTHAPLSELEKRCRALDSAWEVPFLTADFKQVLPLREALRTFDLSDVSRRLERIFRFSGAGYSVAQHQMVAASTLCPQPGESEGRFQLREFAVATHDLEEAILGDVLRPVESILALFGLDLGLWNEFKNSVRYKLRHQLYGRAAGGVNPEEVAHADNQAMLQELKHLRARERACPAFSWNAIGGGPEPAGQLNVLSSPFSSDRGV